MNRIRDTASGNVTNFTNSCVPFEEGYRYDLMNKISLRMILGFFYFLVWVLGVGGNILVVYVAFTRRLAFNVRSIFVIALAFSDIFIGMTSLPITAITAFTREWVFPHLLCYCIGFFQAVGIFVSSFTLCAIAVDRYFLIAYPQKNIVTPGTASLTLASMFGLSVVLASPMAVHMKLLPDPVICGLFCSEVWPDHDPISPQWYCASVLMLQFGLPCAISAVCYWRIGRLLEEQIRKRMKHEILMPLAESRLYERRRRTSRMMTLMVVGFVISWLPINIINSLRDFTPLFLDSNELGFLFTAAHIIAMSSLVYNPVIYSWFKEPFRLALKSIFLGTRNKRQLALRKKL